MLDHSQSHYEQNLGEPMQAEQLTVIVREILDQFALELETLDVVGSGSHRVLRIVVDGDGPDGRGPSLDDIAAATQAISRHLDEEPAVGDRPYTLEIGTRGVSRPLTEPKHWRRNRGRLVEVQRLGAEPVTGRILETDEQSATLEVKVPREKGAKGPKWTTATVQISFAEVSTAKIQVELTKPHENNTTEEPVEG